MDVLAIATLGYITSETLAASDLGDKSGAAMRRDFDIIRGTTFEFDGVARKRNGDIINLSGASLAWRLGSQDLRSTSVTLTETDGISVTDAALGKYSIKLQPAKTENLQPVLYKHQFEVTESDGDVSAVMVGRLDLTRDLD